LELDTPLPEGYTRTVDLSSFTALDNATDAYFRLVANITGLPDGTSQIDNFIVSGVAVPEPARCIARN